MTPELPNDEETNNTWDGYLEEVNLEWEDARELTLNELSARIETVDTDIDITAYPDCGNRVGEAAMVLRFRVPVEPWPGLVNGDTYRDVVLSGEAAFALSSVMNRILQHVASTDAESEKGADGSRRFRKKHGEPSFTVQFESTGGGCDV